MKTFLLFYFLVLSILYAYTPGKWSYLDRFVVGNEKFGPVSEIVKNRTGQTIYSAMYEYNVEGKLIKEKFLNAKGENDGEIVYTYDSGKVKTEEVFSPDKQSQEKKTFSYASSGNLKEIIITSASGKGVLRHKINSIQDGFVLDCETKWEEEGAQESFSSKKDVLDETILNQEIFDDKKKSIGFIKYYYDKKGRIEKRENMQGNSKRMQLLTYDESGKLISFSFHVKQDENWVLVKTHYLTYNSNNTQ
ncbi:MAG TPA: hypothetical protein PK079_09665 [Leptospiraceae bacterium]|nr:hypothetical protein [Leptospiraceae bacterium]HMW04573.1 hypothetical protein [Leptospiraceae bacterium]HMX33274.1 hypothetical protein [Leptospiraceae bacterium]HMY30759.1 hypothetical protein [Leptospiraceae bacterium]HMZ64337.1 hypothetical protein [Leptospiraceae bacterium]